MTYNPILLYIENPIILINRYEYVRIHPYVLVINMIISMYVWIYEPQVY